MLYPTTEAARRRLSGDWRWPHFSIRELACKCEGQHCQGEYWHDPRSLDGLEQMRALLGGALIVSSGHRCLEWNRAVGGVSASRHRRFAADLLVAGHDRHAMLKAAQSAGFTGLGLGKRFLHVDRRGQPAQWDYNGSGTLWMT